MIYIYILILFYYTLAIDASRQVSLKSVYWFRRRRFLMGFYHIWAWQPSLSCDLDYLYTHWFPHSIDASHKIWLWLAKRFLRRRRLNIVEIYIYIAPGWGHMSPWGPVYFRIINIQSYCPFPARLTLNYILKVFPIQMHWRPLLTLP